MHKINPVLVSGIKRRMRGVRTMILMSVYFLLLLGVFGLTYSAIAGVGSYSSSYYYYSSDYVPRPGVEGMDLLLPMYALLVVGMLLLVLLLVPALNAGNISSEREKQTLDLLLSSRLSAIKIVLGKVFSNLAFTVFLLMLTLPFFAILYLFGSILPMDVVAVFLFIIITAYACASIATFFSALMKRTAMATILTYVALIAFCVFTLVAGAFIAADPNYTSSEPPLILRINPLYALIEVVINAASGGTSATAVNLFTGDSGIWSMVCSAIFMLIASPLLNIFSAVLIKPVQKMQISRRPPAPVYYLTPPPAAADAPAGPMPAGQPYETAPPAMGAAPVAPGPNPQNPGGTTHYGQTEQPWQPEQPQPAPAPAEDPPAQ